MRARAPFDRRAADALADPQLQEALGRMTTRFRELRRRAFAGVPAPDALRARARESRARTLRELDRHMERLVTNVERAGGRVHFARTGEEACRLVAELARARGVRTAVKGKSMASEEIELNHALEQAGVRAYETDMGEWILQLAGERPSHLIAPAIHKTRAQVAELFRRHSGESLGDDAEALTAFARRTLRGYFLEAEMGVSGVNFAVAETGTLVLVTNEGNGRMVTTLPRLHVALMGVEKVVPTLDDLATLLAVLPRSATGQKLTSYVTLLTGPRKPGEADGPEELHLVILDAGRTRHLGGPFEEALLCIRCGACLNACPVYGKAGGHSYDSVYAGPIGSILTPMLRAGEQDFELPTASSLCGACLEACPVMVDIPRMLLDMRAARVEQRKAPLAERLAFRFLSFLFRHPQLYDAAGRLGALLQRPFLRDGRLRKLPGPLRAWTRGRDLPPLARKPFRVRWRERERGRRVETSAPSPPFTPPPEEEFTPRVAKTLSLREGHPPHVQVDRPAEEAPAAPSWASVEARLESFIREVEAVGGNVHRARECGGAVGAVLKALGERRDGPVALWGREALGGLDLAGALRERGFEVIEGEADRGSLARAAAGVTGLEAALAETGTILLRSGPGMPRLTSLLPPIHVVLLHPRKLLGGIEELGGWLRECIFGGAPPSCVNLITGPSRTADIELSLILGVHGPGEVHVVVLEEGEEA